MAHNFLSCDRDQPMLLPPDLRDWLDDDHLVWFVIDAVSELDLETCRRRLTEDWRVERRANRRYEAYRARGVMRDGRPFGSPPKPYSPSEAPDGKLNTTNPDARRMKFGRNFMPAYNAQAVTTSKQIIVAAEITTKGGDFEELDP